MTKIRFDISKALPFVDKTSFETITEEVMRQHQTLLSGTGKGNDHLGWLHLPSLATPGFIDRIKEDSKRIRTDSKIFVVIGIGGSYLGARAVIEALADPFSAYSPGNKDILVVYAGENLSEDYHHSLLKLLDEVDYSVAVISKSGTTTEPAVAFRIIKSHIEKKYGREKAASRIIAITDAAKGALKKMAEIENYTTYVIPDDVGGRYSVLTPVGLLPIAVAGFNVARLLEGARMMEEMLFSSPDPEINSAVIYAAIRNALYRNGKTVEVLVNYEPRLFFLGEWWKQLFGESEGKENKGIFPAGVSFTTDLHSMGQYIQEGLRNLFETVISVEQSGSLLQVPADADNYDGLNYLQGKKLSEINYMAELGTLLAHVDGGVPNIRITLPVINEETIGQLIYFFEFSCALSGYMLGVNPFDQPGVEAYKKNMFALLGKPGFEMKGAELRKRAGLND
jgi:glucose-6-phosphate isomerase